MVREDGTTFIQAIVVASAAARQNINRSHRGPARESLIRSVGRPNAPWRSYRRLRELGLHPHEISRGKSTNELMWLHKFLIGDCPACPDFE
jgi:hypothetical protein